MVQKRLIAILILLSSSLVAAAQTEPEQYVPRLQLKVKEKLLVPNLFGTFWGGINTLCDEKGNLYARPDGRGPIVRVSADGQKVTNIDIKPLPDFAGNRYISAWTIGLRGEVHLIALNKDRQECLLTLDDEGDLRSSGKLDSEFFFYHLAVFPSGELLGVGVKEHEGMNDVVGEPYTAIFDRNGKLLTELTLPGDLKGHRVNEKSDDYTSEKAIFFGQEVPADDGNIYLMRNTGRHPLFVISPAGDVVRKLSLDPPGEGWEGFQYFVAGGKILMEFYKPEASVRDANTLLYSLYDAESAERQIDYELSPEISGQFACYNPNQFTFLAPERDGLSIIHAAPK